jgi:formylglycine-generating enzyme required for sulfatase activity
MAHEYTHALQAGDRPALAPESAPWIAEGLGCLCEMARFTNGEFKPEMKEYDYPVVAIDWCDAYAYCQWAGRRLCGKIGGGPLATDDGFDPTKNQWMKACVGPSTFAYPYGDSFVEGRCNGPLAQSEGEVAPVASLPQCVGRYPGLYDMSGNAAEWLDSCGAAESNSYCAQRGGDWRRRGAGPSPMALSCGAGANSARSAGDSSSGFRCCGP